VVIFIIQSVLIASTSIVEDCGKQGLRRIRINHQSLEAGATLAGEPQDIGGGTRIATVTDADGNTLGLIQGS
jgi:hypothetical protein